jgi:hypothetical protein
VWKKQTGEIILAALRRLHAIDACDGAMLMRWSFGQVDLCRGDG